MPPRAHPLELPTPPPVQLVHGDVFRFPPNLNLFCAVVGTGTQILVMALMIFALSLLGTYYPYNGGAMLTSVVVFYALTAGVAGYVSAALYKIMGGEPGRRHGRQRSDLSNRTATATEQQQWAGHALPVSTLLRCPPWHVSSHTTTPLRKPAMPTLILLTPPPPLTHPRPGTNWVRNVLTTTMLFCGPLLAMFSYLNSVAWAYGTTAALPFGTIVIIIVIWALVTFPLTVVGGIMGKNTKVRG